MFPSIFIDSNWFSCFTPPWLVEPTHFSQKEWFHSNFRSSMCQAFLAFTYFYGPTDASWRFLNGFPCKFYQISLKLDFQSKRQICQDSAFVNAKSKRCYNASSADSMRSSYGFSCMVFKAFRQKSCMHASIQSFALVYVVCRSIVAWAMKFLLQPTMPLWMHMSTSIFDVLYENRKWYASALFACKLMSRDVVPLGHKIMSWMNLMRCWFRRLIQPLALHVFIHISKPCKLTTAIFDPNFDTPIKLFFFSL